MNPIHFSSMSPEWSTPQDLFDGLNGHFRFTLDVCATPENAKCKRFFTPQQDGLTQVWTGTCWMNPPYGEPEHPCKKRCPKKRCEKRGWHTDKYIAGCYDFMEKAVASVLSDTAELVVCLLPARTDTAWFHDFIWSASTRTPRPGVTVDLLRGRLKFGGSKNSAPFPSMVVTFGPITDSSTHSNPESSDV